MKVKTSELSAVKEKQWIEITLTLMPEDIRSLQVSAHIGGDSSGIIEHIVTLAQDKQLIKEGECDENL